MLASRRSASRKRDAHHVSNGSLRSRVWCRLRRMQRLTLMLRGIVRRNRSLLVRHRSSLNVVSGRHMKAMVEEPHVVIVTVLSAIAVILRCLWLSRHHWCSGSCSSHRSLWSSIARTLMAMVVLRKLRGRCVLEGTLVVQSLRINIDSRSRLVLSGY